MTNNPEDSGGFSAALASERLATDGPNELLRARQRRLLRIAAEVWREAMLAVGLGMLMLLLLEACNGLIRHFAGRLALTGPTAQPQPTRIPA